MKFTSKSFPDHPLYFRCVACGRMGKYEETNVMSQSVQMGRASGQINAVYCRDSVPCEAGAKEYLREQVASVRESWGEAEVVWPKSCQVAQTAVPGPKHEG